MYYRGWVPCQNFKCPCIDKAVEAVDVLAGKAKLAIAW